MDAQNPFLDKPHARGGSLQYEGSDDASVVSAYIGGLGRIYHRRILLIHPPDVQGHFGIVRNINSQGNVIDERVPDFGESFCEGIHPGTESFSSDRFGCRLRFEIRRFGFCLRCLFAIRPYKKDSSANQ